MLVVLNTEESYIYIYRSNETEMLKTTKKNRQNKRLRNKTMQKEKTGSENGNNVIICL